MSAGTAAAMHAAARCSLRGVAPAPPEARPLRPAADGSQGEAAVLAADAAAGSRDAALHALDLPHQDVLAQQGPFDSAHQAPDPFKQSGAAEPRSGKRRRASGSSLPELFLQTFKAVRSCPAVLDGAHDRPAAGGRGRSGAAALLAGSASGGSAVYLGTGADMGEFRIMRSNGPLALT
jgi:hypothetical protein